MPPRPLATGSLYAGGRGPRAQLQALGARRETLESYSLPPAWLPQDFIKAKGNVLIAGAGLLLAINLTSKLAFDW